MTTMMKVICISERKSKYIEKGELSRIKKRELSRIKKGEVYYINKESVWVDCDGDAYGEVYSTDNNYIGQMLLSHFQSL